MFASALVALNLKSWPCLISPDICIAINNRNKKIPANTPKASHVRYTILFKSGCRMTEGPVFRECKQAHLIVRREELIRSSAGIPLREFCRSFGMITLSRSDMLEAGAGSGDSRENRVESCWTVQEERVKGPSRVIRERMELLHQWFKKGWGFYCVIVGGWRSYWVIMGGYRSYWVIMGSWGSYWVTFRS